MRRTALRPAAYAFAATLLLSGCASYVGNPTDGMGGFLGDVFSWRGAPNRPAIESANADMAPSFKSEDFKEGVAHFVEKRAAKFTGR